MIDKLLDVGASFDWITPLLALTQDLLNGPSHSFSIPSGCGLSPREVGQMLQRYGVKSWGYTLHGDRILLSVRQRQARWAQYLLDRAGIPLEGGRVGRPSDRPARSRPGENRKTASGKRGGLLGDLWDQRLF